MRRRGRCRRCRARGQSSRTRAVPCGRVERERDSVEPVRVDLARCDVELRSRVPTALAPVRAEVPDVRGVEHVRRTAADAVLRVGCVLEPTAGARGVVDAEAQDMLATVGERGDERIVGVGDERGVGGERSDRCPPSLCDVLELPVAVELVAKQVPEAHDTRPRAPHDLRERELVDLEQPQLGVAYGKHRRGDARREVRTGVVPGETARGGENRRGHRGRRRLPVGRRDERDPLRQPARERVECPGIELPHELPGKRRPAAAAGRAGEPADETGGGRLEGESRAHPPERTHAHRPARTSLQIMEDDLV